MRATFTSEQELLAQTATDMASQGLDAARILLDGGPRSPEPTASLFEGFAGLGIPESLGGAGGDLVDVVVLVEALARRVTPTAFVSHLMAVQIARGADIPLASEVLEGSRRLVVGVNPAPARPGDITLDGVGSTGTVRAVPDGADAEFLVVVDAAARAALATVTATRPRPGLDPSRPLADLDVEVVSSPVPVRNGLLRAAVIAAGDLIGVGRGALRVAAEYATQRHQFGQPIGKFQGVAHPLAEADAGLESAWSLALYAAWALDAEAPDAIETAHAAKARAGQAAVHAAERALQAHGGIGMTWEAVPHLFLRRALAVDGWIGGRSEHRRRLGARLLGVAS